MNQKLLKSIVLTTLLTSSYVVAQTNSNGFYIGLDTAFINMGDDTLNIRVNDSDGNFKSEKKYRDVTSINYGFKFGYQHFNQNRVELLIKDKKISTDEGNIRGTSLGINYEWGFSSFESENILPYISLGVDVGQAKFEKFDLAINDKEVDAVGFNLGIGIHYAINENVDAKIGYIHSNTVFGDFENDKGDITDIAQDKVEFGFSYKF